MLNRGLPALLASTIAFGVVAGGVATFAAAPAGAVNAVPAMAAPVETAASASSAAATEGVDVTAVRVTDGFASRSSEREGLSALDARNAALTATAQAIADREAAIEAERKAEEERVAAERAAFIASEGYTPETTDPKDIARQMAASKYGWGEDQFTCYNNIIMRESKWDTFADNPTSSAYGIPQALPGSKMASEGADWETNPATQIKWGLKYVKDRFGTPCSAWSFKAANGWY